MSQQSSCPTDLTELELTPEELERAHRLVAELGGSLENAIAAVQDAKRALHNAKPADPDAPVRAILGFSKGITIVRHSS